MNDYLIDIIYDLIKDYDFYSYDDKFKDIKLEKFYNLEYDKCIKINLEHESYILTITEIK
ncbi:MAG TPA: hypothetical protein GX708_01670 [Gallicola sp.]|nr:hypothetical protein [Gallicola sp.]